jgi:hypothetical protein
MVKYRTFENDSDSDPQIKKLRSALGQLLESGIWNSEFMYSGNLSGLQYNDLYTLMVTC